MASENRSQSQGRKQLPAHARPSKPPPLHRSRHSYNHGHHATVSHSRPGGLTKKHSSSTVPQITKFKKEEEDNEDDMASFDQFCATCEKQIVTPDSSVLYCSESCRKKDVSKPGQQSIHSPPITPGSLIESSSYFDIPSTDIMPQRSPTVARPPSMAFSELSLTEEEEEDEEPPSERPAGAFGRRDSEASKYLAQFHDANHAHRTRSNRHSSDNSGLPSLIHSPSSSIGTAASLATSSSRPQLPSRTNPLYSSFHNGTKSIDLVNPFASDAAAASSLAPSTDSGSLKSGASVRTAFRVVEGEEMSYQKRPSVGHAGHGSGSLKHLFGEAIRGLPKEPVTLRRPRSEEALEES